MVIPSALARVSAVCIDQPCGALGNESVDTLTGFSRYCFRKALHKSSMTEQSTINKKCDFYLSHIINNLKVIDNGGTSLYRRNTAISRVSLTKN